MITPGASLRVARFRPAWQTALDARREELFKAGATRDQAYVMALDEAMRESQSEIARLRSVMEDAAHFAELGRDVSRYLRETGLRQELTPSA